MDEREEKSCKKLNHVEGVRRPRSIPICLIPRKHITPSVSTFLSFSKHTNAYLNYIETNTIFVVSHDRFFFVFGVISSRTLIDSL